MAITLVRVAAGPVVAALVLYANAAPAGDAATYNLIAAILFIVAALSDWLDGYLARRMNAVTTLGAALDHGADKVLAASAIVALAGSLPTDLVLAGVVLIARDFLIGGLREGYAAEGRAPAVSFIGKWKTSLVLAGLAGLLILRCVTGEATLLLSASRALIWASVAASLWSALLYVRALLAKP